MTEASCVSCFFYRYSRIDGYAGQIGTCRYNPPSSGKSWNEFPEVKESAWCGKWQGK